MHYKWFLIKINGYIQVDFLSLKKSLQNKGSTYMAELKSKLLPQSGQPAEQSIYTT